MTIDKIKKLKVQCGTYAIARMLYRNGVSLEVALQLLTRE